MLYTCCLLFVYALTNDTKLNQCKVLPEISVLVYTVKIQTLFTSPQTIQALTANIMSKMMDHVGGLYFAIWIVSIFTTVIFFKSHNNYSAWVRSHVLLDCPQSNAILENSQLSVSCAFQHLSFSCFKTLINLSDNNLTDSIGTTHFLRVRLYF